VKFLYTYVLRAHILVSDNNAGIIGS